MKKLVLILACIVSVSIFSITAFAVDPCPGASVPSQCGYFTSATLPPFVEDAIIAKNGTPGSGNVLVLSSGDPADGDTDLSTNMGNAGCGLNPDGFITNDCVQLSNFVPDENSIIIAISSEWPEFFQTSFTDWMTIEGPGVGEVDVSINNWNSGLVSIIAYGPSDTGVIILTTVGTSKNVSFRVADSGDEIYDTALIAVPASWFNQDQEGLLCGNNITDPGEECDDGNLLNGDSCSAICLIESASSICGNNQVETGESCDDGNKIPGDGCSTICQIEQTPAAICGNNQVEEGETCDDGNTESADGCSDSCQNEIQIPEGAICGNNEIEDAEACDDGNTQDGDGCSSVCEFEEQPSEIPEFGLISGVLAVGASLAGLALLRKK